MQLTGAQVALLKAALLDAYTTATLETMVRIELNLPLERITRPGPLDQIVADLVSWAERTDQVAALLAGACAHNPGNVALQALAARAQAEAWFANPPPTAAPPPAPRSRVAQIKQKALSDRLSQLIAQYEAGMAQLNSTLSAIDAIKLQHQLRALEADMRSVEAQLADLAAAAEAASLW